MDDHQAKALCPLDGRYKDRLGNILDDFSEMGQTRLRVKVEARYLLFLGKVLGFETPPEEWLANLSLGDFEAIKALEARFNHDVKAVEVWMGTRLPTGMESLKPWIHFGLTSQDVAGTAVALALKDFSYRYVSLIDRVMVRLAIIVSTNPSTPMVGHTHGQVATPTTMGAELGVFVYRLKEVRKDYALLRHMTKFGGAVGKLNAHKVAFEGKDWPSLMRDFVETLGLVREETSTQSSSYDAFGKMFHWMSRLSMILLDLCRDLRLYLSKGYLTLQARKEEVGSSTMPHKINPMHFENAEGNFELGSVILSFLALRLPRSRIQHDLTDSTLCRSVGTGLGYLVVGLTSLLRGLDRLTYCPTKAMDDLEAHPEVLAEAYQTLLRREGIPDAYDRLKSLTRGPTKPLTLTRMHEWIEGQKDFPEALKLEMKSLRPSNYTGYA